MKSERDGMSLPEDLSSLIRSPAEREQAGRALELLKLGIARAGLSDWREADRLLDEAGIAFSAVGSQLGDEGAAAAVVRRALVAMSEERYGDALNIMEQMVEQSGGFPEITLFPELLAPGLDAWLWLIERAEDDQRLYDEADTALKRLGEPRSQAERLAVAKGLVRRAKSGEALGHTDGGAEMYERAITLLEAETTASLDAESSAQAAHYLDVATVSVAVLLAKLERDEEANAAFGRIVAKYADSTDPRLQATVAAARGWLEAQEED
jgi:tetratricopeptide (TPR) repeat protein